MEFVAAGIDAAHRQLATAGVLAMAVAGDIRFSFGHGHGKKVIVLYRCSQV